MRVTIDYTSAMRQRAGVGRYTRNLVSALALLDKENSYTLFCAGEGPRKQGWPANFDIRTSPVPEQFLTAAWHKLRLPIAAEHIAGPTDIFHAPDFTLPPLDRARGIVTIHDLSFLKLPQCADPGLCQYLTRRVPLSVTRATRVLADSENTRQDLIELLGTPPEKISVVYAGVEPRFHPERDVRRLAEVRQRYQLPELFILFVGTIEPRKNLSRLISAYAQMRRQTDLPHQLVLSGSRGWLYEDIFLQVEREGLREAVRFTGFIAEEDLPAFYSMADLFVFPSLYEGFGLPPLEAMACGAPVLASNNSSLPEVLGTAAWLVDAVDTAGLANAMSVLLNDAALRSRLSVLGQAQAARFTWQQAAQHLVQAYKMAID